MVVKVFVEGYSVLVRGISLRLSLERERGGNLQELMKEEKETRKEVQKAETPQQTPEKPEERPRAFAPARDNLSLNQLHIHAQERKLRLAKLLFRVYSYW